MVHIGDCGIMLEPQEGMAVRQLIGWAKYSERQGYGHFFRSDHLLPTSGARGIDSPECWVTLGAVAASTERIAFGPLVSPVGFRNPALIARMACSLGAYTEGRLALGLGAGWYKDEFDAHGLNFPGVRERFDRYAEALAIVRPLIDGVKVDFKGRFFEVHTEILPKVPSKMRLIVGGKGRRTAKLAAKYADEYNVVMVTPSSLDELMAVISNSGRASDLPISRMGPFIIADNKQGLREKVTRYARRRGLDGDPDRIAQGLVGRGFLCGTPDEFTEQMNVLSNRGVKRYYFQLFDLEDVDMIDSLTSYLKSLG